MMLDFNQHVANVSGAPNSHLDGQRFTLEQYREALQKPIDYPDKNDPDDPRYYTKYAHTIPPPEAYLTRPPGWEKINLAEASNCRVIFDWSNISEYEKEKVKLLRVTIEELNVVIPEHITETTLLKYGMSEQWDMKKAAQKFVDTLKWLSSPPKIRLTPKSIKLLQSGSFYVLGRDKWYKPSIIMDLGKMVELTRQDPACITVEVFLDLFAYLWEYVVRAMFLPG